MSYAFVLLAYIKQFDTSNKGLDSEQLAWATTLWFKMVDFLKTADLIQVRYIGQEVREIVSFLEPLAHALGKVSLLHRCTLTLADKPFKPGAAVAPMAHFILRLDPQGSTLSSQHLQLCQIALRTGTFGDAAPVLEHDILFVPTTASHREQKYLCASDLAPHHFITEMLGHTKVQTASSMQEFFLLAANILIGLHNWERAAQLLENAISYPAKSGAMSGPMLEAYKKWVLVQLMLDGKVPKHLPKMVNSKMAETVHTMAAPYEAVANLFERGTPRRLQAEIAAGAFRWEEDGNDGLIRLMLESYQERRIISMSSVFTTVPISYIAQASASTETGDVTTETAVIDLINAMIQRRQFHGKLTTDSNGKSFLCFDKSEHPQDELMVSQIPAAIAGVHGLMEDVRAMNRMIATEKDYLKWMNKQTKGNGGGSAQSVMNNSTWQVGPDDEDLMAN